MAEVSSGLDARSRKTMALLLTRAQAATNRRIAATLEIEESTLSRWRDDHLARAVSYVLAVGCKVVPADLICVDARRLDALEYYAEIGMKQQQHDRTTVLEWDE